MLSNTGEGIEEKNENARSQFCPSTDAVALRTFDVKLTGDFQIRARISASLKFFLSNVIEIVYIIYISHITHYELTFDIEYSVIRLVCNVFLTDCNDAS